MKEKTLLEVEPYLEPSDRFDNGGFDFFSILFTPSIIFSFFVSLISLIATVYFGKKAYVSLKKIKKLNVSSKDIKAKSETKPLPPPTRPKVDPKIYSQKKEKEKD